MKYKKAKKQLQYALRHQKTISINKLRNIMQAMNISLEPSRDEEIKYLKQEIKKLNRLVKKNLKGE